MKKRTKKLTLGVKIISILSCIALVSVGFASWWIVKTPDEPITKAGSFEVYAVEEKNVEITAAFADENDAKITFGKDTAYTPTNKWLSADDDTVENLGTTLNVTVSIDDEETNVGDVLQTVTVALKLDATTQAAVTAGTYITAPVVKYNGETATYDADSQSYKLDVDVSELEQNSVTMAVTIDFGWGSAFGGVNPYKHYDQAYTAELAQDAFAKLNALSTSGLNNGAYTVSITATVK